MSNRINKTDTIIRINQNQKDDNKTLIFNNFNVNLNINKNEFLYYDYKDILNNNDNLDINLFKNISSKRNGIFIVYTNDISNSDLNLSVDLIKKYTIPSFITIPLDFNINKLNNFKDEYKQIVKKIYNSGSAILLYIDYNKYQNFDALYKYLNSDLIKDFSKYFSGIYIDNYPTNIQYLTNNNIQILKNELNYNFLVINIKTFNNINVLSNLNQVDMVVIKDGNDLSFNLDNIFNYDYTKYNYVFIANNINNYSNIDKQLLKSILQHFGYIYITLNKNSIPSYLDNLLSDIEKYNIDLQLKVNIPQPDKITITFNNEGNYSVIDNVINAKSVNGYSVDNNKTSNSLWTSDKILNVINQATNGLYPPDNYTIIVSNNQLKVADNVINAKSVNGYVVNDNDASQLWTGNKILSEINRVIGNLVLPIPDNYTIKVVNGKLTVQNGVIDGYSVNGVSVNNNLIGNYLWTSDKIKQYIDEKINEKFNIYYNSFDNGDNYIIFEFDSITYYLTNNINDYIDVNNTNFKSGEIYYVYDIISNRLYFVDKYSNYVREINYIPLIISSREYRDGYIRILNNSRIQYRYDNTNYENVIPLVGARYFNIINEVDIVNYKPMFFINPGSSLSIKNVDYIPIIFNKNIDYHFKITLTKTLSQNDIDVVKLVDIAPYSTYSVELKDDSVYSIRHYHDHTIASRVANTNVLYGIGDIYINTNMHIRFMYINKNGNLVIVSGYTHLDNTMIFNNEGYYYSSYINPIYYVKFNNSINIYINRFV